MDAEPTRDPVASRLKARDFFASSGITGEAAGRRDHGFALVGAKAKGAAVDITPALHSTLEAETTAAPAAWLDAMLDSFEAHSLAG